jgi:hypothetical protein
MPRPNTNRAQSHGSLPDSARVNVQQARETRVARPVRSPFDLGLLPADGTRSSERSLQLAAKLTLPIGVGDASPVISHYLGAVSFAPFEHLEILERRGARLAFAPTIGAALTSSELAARRKETLTLQQCQEMHDTYSHQAGVVAVYDDETDALIFPTAYRARDVEHPVFHELGHALTMPHSHETSYSALLSGLPLHIRRHLRPYRLAGATLDELACEVLAEAYVLLLVGRSAELPGSVLSELFAMLTP